MSPLTDLQRTERLVEGDACEFRYPARRTWQRGTVAHNGGSGYWRILDESGKSVEGLYIEYIRAPGTDPWSGF